MDVSVSNKQASQASLDEGPSSREQVHVSFRCVDKSFDQRTKVVDQLNLDVRRGEFLTLLGPSGSGKTTCLMMLAGFEAPDSGTIQIDGQAVHDIPPHARNIGMVFQNYALFPHMTVAENLSFPHKVRGTPKAERDERIESALSLVRLGGFGDRKPAQLSGGQQQRVAIARSLVYEPNIVLMDEPLGALDRKLREEMQFEIRRIQRAVGVTMVYVTHDQEEAMVLSDRIAVFNAGKIQQLADPETLYEEPTQAFVAGFIGENNQILGTVESRDVGICHININGELIQAVPINEPKIGDEVSVSIRPERMVFGRNHLGMSNTFKGKVKDIVFLGDHLRLLATACGGEEFIIKTSNIAGHGGVLQGDDIFIGWAALDCRAIPLD